MRSFFCLALLFLSFAVTNASGTDQKTRDRANKLLKDGNWADALGKYRELLEGEDRVGKAGTRAADLQYANQCIQRLGQYGLFDELVENAIAADPDNWHMLRAAAEAYTGAQHQGWVTGNEEFTRNRRAREGRYVNVYNRDRVRALQLLEKCLPLTDESIDKGSQAIFYSQFSQLIMALGQTWRLQSLTDLSELPPYPEESGHRGYYGRGHYGHGYGFGRQKGAPVDEEGAPVFHQLPKSWKEARSDGERYRWLLMMRAETNPPEHIMDPMLEWGHFLHSQFGTRSLAHYPGFGEWFKNRGTRGGDDPGSEPSRFELHSLPTTDTIAWLAPGPERIALPDEYNFIKVFEQVAANNPKSHGASALASLANLHQDRRQYDKAAEYWQGIIDRYEPHTHNATKALAQITDNWGRFDDSGMQPAGSDAKVGFVFRNATGVQFQAQQIKVEQIVKDVVAYLSEKPHQVDRNKLNVQNLGHLLVSQNQEKYLGETVANWSLDLKPAPNHWDQRIEVETPMEEAGAYLLTAKMKDGHESKTIVWIADTVAQKKQLDHGELFLVNDAVTGEPIKNARVEFFEWGQQQVKGLLKNKKLPNGAPRYETFTKVSTEKTDADGQAKFDYAARQKEEKSYQRLVVVTTDDGRFTFNGWDHVGSWFFRNRAHVQKYQQTKTFVATDRPAYRPDQKVMFKAWTREVAYDAPEDKSKYGNKTFMVRVINPKGERILDKDIEADEFGGVEGEVMLEEGCPLGQYQVHVGWRKNEHVLGNVGFRVEEYKKPEFEVTVEAPEKPIRLGETIVAKVKADYYFGAPVAKGTVKYKVTRSKHDEQWFPSRPWDWLYGKGYWWYSADYAWYPGWGRWGCRAPYWSWMGWSPDPPEVVIEGEAELSPNGTLDLEIDTGPAAEIHGDSDHRYSVEVSVTDDSRRIIDGTGSVLVTRDPFKVFAWLDRGHYRVGDPITANFRAQTPDQKPVTGKGILKLMSITYDADNPSTPKETEVAQFAIDPDDEGQAVHKLNADKAGQYRLSYAVTDEEGHRMEGGYVFVVHGDGFDGKDFRFNALEVVTDKAEYLPGETVRLMINTERPESTVALFVRPAGGFYEKPKTLRLDGKSTVHEIKVDQADMPNFYVEAVTVSDGKVHTVVRQIIVPPSKRVMNVEVLPSDDRYTPGEEAKIKVKLTGIDGKPVTGSTVVSVYDKALEYISGGSNVQNIRDFFWQWKRHHSPQKWNTLGKHSGNLVKPGEDPMNFLGMFGRSLANDYRYAGVGGGGAIMLGGMAAEADSSPMASGVAAPRSRAMLSKSASFGRKEALGEELDENGRADQQAPPNAAVGDNFAEATIRTKLADSAFWVAAVNADKDGIAEVVVDMPDNLTTWKVKTWSMGHGTLVGQGETEVITSKNLLLRQQAPRFFIEKDEVILSANVHNYLDTDKEVRVLLELEGGAVAPMDPAQQTQTVTIPAGGEARIDWRVKAIAEGEIAVRMKALTDEESDAMEISYPVRVHGMLKTESWSGLLRPDKDTAKLRFDIPEERRINDTKLTVRYSPTIAGAMVDALPYLADFPYGCTEQTLNRFVPTVITRKILADMDLDLKDIEEKVNNLNPQELGDPDDRAAQWKRFQRNPVFSEKKIDKMVRQGINRLSSMQNGDGGWGWFSGTGERSYPHTTATVVRGLIVAKANGAKVDEKSLNRGVQWLKQYEAKEYQKILNGRMDPAVKPWKGNADSNDAYVASVLAQAGQFHDKMLTELYDARQAHPVYTKALTGMALHLKGREKERDMILRNIEQFLQRDRENQTAYLELGNEGYWWYWYGNEVEAHAHYLKLLVAADSESKDAPMLVKYLLNNRKHGTYWNSTRDTALCIEAIADYFHASGESSPDMTLVVKVDGEEQKKVKITTENLFSFDDRFEIKGDALDSGKHNITFEREGEGPVYFNAYLENFTLENFIEKAGLEVKVRRRYFKLVPTERKEKVAGARAQVVDQKIEAYDRVEIKNQGSLQSGDLVEVQLVVESKNDYEYIMIEDLKPAGLEPVDIRSGYDWGPGRGNLHAYREMRDEKVAFFLKRLPRGSHTLTYRTRAEIPGKFSALPAKVSGMYAPELRGNSDELKVTVTDRE